MKIVAGEMEIQVLGAFEDFLYEQDQKRPALRMRFGRMLSQDEMAALNGQTIALIDDTGAQIGSYEGYNTVHECIVTMVRVSTVEQERDALDQEMQTVRLALASAGISLEDLLQAQVQQDEVKQAALEQLTPQNTKEAL